jgi:hypothetical protein
MFFRIFNPSCQGCCRNDILWQVRAGVSGSKLLVAGSPSNLLTFLLLNDITRTFIVMIHVFYCRHLKSGFITAQLEIVQVLKRSKFLCSPLRIRNLLPLQISPYNTEYFDSTNPLNYSSDQKCQNEKLRRLKSGELF